MYVCMQAIVKEAGEAFVNTLKRMNMSSIATAMNGYGISIMTHTYRYTYIYIAYFFIHIILSVRSAMDSNNPVGSADNEKG